MEGSFLPSKLYNIPLIRVHARRLAVAALAGKAEHSIILVDVAVDQIAGMPAVHQAQEGLKALVRQILHVPHPPCRRVGQQDVEALVFTQLPPQPAGPTGHLALGVHMGLIGAVAHAAPQPQHPHAVDHNDVIFRADAALRGLFFVAVVMVAVDIQYRRVGKAGQEGQILRGQIAAGQDQVHALQKAPVQIVPEPNDYPAAKAAILNKTVYWAAVDKLQYAKQIDPTCAEAANSLISSFSKYFPTKEDIFDLPNELGGATFVVGGWINEKTVCRPAK